MPLLPSLLPHLRVLGDGAALGVEERQSRVHFGVHGSFLAQRRARRTLSFPQAKGIGEGESEVWVERSRSRKTKTIFLSTFSSKNKTLLSTKTKTREMASDDERRVQQQLQQELQVAYMQEFYSVRASESERRGGE